MNKIAELRFSFEENNYHSFHGREQLKYFYTMVESGNAGELFLGNNFLIIIF